MHLCTISVCCRFGQSTTKPNSCVLMSWMQQALLLWQKGGPGSEVESFRGPFESLWTMHLRQCWTMQNGLVILGFISICCLQGAHSLWRPGIAAAAAPDIVYIIVFVKWFICGFSDICLGFQSLFWSTQASTTGLRWFWKGSRHMNPRQWVNLLNLICWPAWKPFGAISVLTWSNLKHHQS